MNDGGSLIPLVERLSGAGVLCVGDVMLDRFVSGRVERISPEAPIPVLRVTEEAAMLGGAGNVVNNIASMGAQAEFVSVMGNDSAAGEVREMLAAISRVGNHIVADDERETSIKTRYLAENQQMLRADRETVTDVSDDVADAVIDNARKALAHCGAMVLSDYGKGVLTNAVLARLIALAAAAKIPAVVDPKGSDYSCYRGATLVTPNLNELRNASGEAAIDDDGVVVAARKLIEGHGIGAVLATRSADGMTLVTAEDEVKHLRAEGREVFDVSGAGDTVVAAMASALAAGASLAEAAELANTAAGIVVGKLGTAKVYMAELIATLHHQDISKAEAKVMTEPEMRERIEIWRRQQLKVGFTNGCFDLLHPGHVSLLDQAKSACDKLIVGLNSDDSVKRLKGDDRPIQSEAARATVLASLATVDAVVIFGDDTPLELIEMLKPDVLVKGADYTVDTVVGADVVQKGGGKVVLAKLADGFSTSDTIRRMNDGGR